MTRPRYGIGGSDVAAVLGLDPRKTPYQLWREKLGMDKPMAPTPATLRGQFLEPAMLDRYMREHQPAEMAVQVYAEAATPEVPARQPWRFGTLDGLARTPDGTQRIVECKSVAKHMHAREWGAQWTDEVPDRALCQGLWYASLVPTAAVIDYVVAVMPDDPDQVLGLSAADVLEQCEVHYYRVQARSDLYGQLIKRAAAFWCDHVLANVPPPVTTPSDISLRWPQHIEGKARVATIEVMDLLRRYDELGEDERAAKQDRDQVRAQLMAFAEDCECIVDPRRNVLLTLKTQERKEHTVAAGTSRVLRLSKFWKDHKQTQSQEIQ